MFLRTNFSNRSKVDKISCTYFGFAHIIPLLCIDAFYQILAESPIPINIVLAINHSIFVNGDSTNFEIDPSFGYEASELYPEVKYSTVEEGLSRFV